MKKRINLLKDKVKNEFKAHFSALISFSFLTRLSKDSLIRWILKNSLTHGTYQIYIFPLSMISGKKSKLIQGILFFKNSNELALTNTQQFYYHSL